MLLFDAFLQKNSFSTHFTRKTPFRRISPKKLLFDAFLQKSSFSTHFSRKTPFRRISPEKLLFDAFLYQKYFFDHTSNKPHFLGYFFSLKRLVDAFLHLNTLVLSHWKIETLYLKPLFSLLAEVHYFAGYSYSLFITAVELFFDILVSLSKILLEFRWLFETRRNKGERTVSYADAFFSCIKKITKKLTSEEKKKSGA